jgi:hypothetical protein
VVPKWTDAVVKSPSPEWWCSVVVEGLLAERAVASMSSTWSGKTAQYSRVFNLWRRPVMP